MPTVLNNNWLGIVNRISKKNFSTLIPEMTKTNLTKTRKKPAAGEQIFHEKSVTLDQNTPSIKKHRTRSIKYHIHLAKKLIDSLLNSLKIFSNISTSSLNTFSSFTLR